MVRIAVTSSAPLASVLLMSLAAAQSDVPAATTGRAASRTTPVLQQFFAAASAPYRLDGELCQSERDRSVLSAQLGAEDRHLRKLATTVFGFERLVRALRDGVELVDEPGSGIAEFQGAIQSEIARAFGGDGAPWRSIAIALQGDHGAIGADLETVEHGLTERLCAPFVSSMIGVAMQGVQQQLLAPPPGKLERGDLEIGFQVKDGDVWLELGLLGDVALRDCAVVCTYRPDRALVLGELGRQQHGEDGWLEVDLAAGMATSKRNQRVLAAAAIAAVDGGSTVFVPVWKPGQVLSVRLTRKAGLLGAPGRGTLSLWSDAVELVERPLPIATACKALGGKVLAPEIEDEAAGAQPSGDSPADAAPGEPTPPDAPAALAPVPGAIELPADGPQVPALIAATRALDARDFTGARTQFAAIVKALEPADEKAAAAQAELPRRVLALARLRGAEAGYRAGIKAERRGKTEEPPGASLLRNADRELQVLTEDFATDREGTSILAAAMRRRILVNGVLYAWYREAAKLRPTVRTFQKQAARHRELAEKVFGELQARFPAARLADGRIVVEAVRTECRALLEK